MGSKVNSQQAPVKWLREITKAKLNPFLFPSFLLKQWKKRGKGKFGQFWASLASLGKFGQVWAFLFKFGQVRTRQQIRKMGEKGRKSKKRKKKLSGDGGGEGGKSRV